MVSIGPSWVHLGFILPLPGEPKMQYVLRFLLIFRIAPRSVKHAPRRSDKAPSILTKLPRGRKKTQEVPTRVSRWPQEGPKTTPCAAQDGPMTAEDGSQITQEVPRRPQEPPKTPPRPPNSAPKELLEPVLRAPSSLEGRKKGRRNGVSP